MYCDGDTYESDGTVTRKYGAVDLGALTWTWFSENEVFYATLANCKGTPWGNSIPNCICEKYDAAGSNKVVISTHTFDRVCYISDTYIYLYDSSAIGKTAAQFAEYVSGTTLVYELATPTIETANPFTNPQVVDKDGTE